MNRVTVGIPSKDRGIEVSLLIYSLLNQTYQDFDILIIDDHSSDFLLANQTFNSLKTLHKNLGHNIEIIKGQQKGPHYCGEEILKNSKTELIFRVDDDVTLQPDCIEKLVDSFEDDLVVAAGPIYLYPSIPMSKQILDLNQTHNYEELGKIYAGYGGIGVNGSLQMNVLLNAEDNIPVEHLHSGFMYNKSKLEKINGYFLGYSKVGHREETDTSYRLFLDGGKLVVCPEAVAFHFHPFWGGIRTDANGTPNETENWENDERIFMKRFMNKFPMDGNNKYDETVPPSLASIGLPGISAYNPPEEPETINQLRQQLEIGPIKSVNETIELKKRPSIHLVTVTHGRHEKLEKLIESVKQYTEEPFTWTVVNNDESDESRTKLIDLTANCLNLINVQLEKELSVSEARNIGAKNRPEYSEYICFVDDDALVLGNWGESWLTMLYNVLKSEKDVGAVSPIYTWFEPLQSHALSVACLLTSVKVWEQVGGFDPVFGNKEKGTWGYEDTDWSYRLQSMGYKIKGIDSEGFPFYHEDTTGKEKTEWQVKGLLKAKELLLSKYDIKEVQKLLKYPFTQEQCEIPGKKLNIGCYYMYMDGFVNVDLNPDCKPDIVGDIRDLEFDNESVSLILNSQTLEHFDLPDVKELLSKFYKWLIFGGHLIIEVPDVGKILNLIEAGEDPKKYEGAIYGNLNVIGQKHISQFDEVLLTNMLKEAGFNCIKKNNNTSDNDEITLRYDIRK